MENLTTEDSLPPLPMIPAEMISPGLRAIRNSPPSNSLTPRTLIPPTVPGYEIVRELGRGGCGVVYLVRDLELDRLVAVKVVLSGAHAGENEIARFKAEALAIAHLRHAGLVHIYRVGESAGLPFCVMEFVSDGNLRERMNPKPISARQAATWLEQIARIMHAVHEMGFVHRDLKPENVLLAADGSIRVADFGLVLRFTPTTASALIAGEPRLTRTGELLGTPSYMAPEQLLGQGSRIGPATDVYALGVILYEMLAANLPFPAGIAEFTQVLTRTAPGIRRLNPEVPRDLETICSKCLRKEPASRYPVMLELADDLQRFLNGKPFDVHQASTRTSPARF